MSHYRVEVTEIRHVHCVYTVDAETEAEAERKAAVGDTVSEEENPNDSEVADRVVHGLAEGVEEDDDTD